MDKNLIRFELLKIAIKTQNTLINIDGDNDIQIDKLKIYFINDRVQFFNNDACIEISDKDIHYISHVNTVRYIHMHLLNGTCQSIKF